MKSKALYLLAIGAVFVALLGASWCVESVTAPEPPYAPLELQGLVIQEEEAAIGEQITVLNGFCNVTDEGIIVEVYVAAQRESGDPLLEAEVIPIIERRAGTGVGRGLTVGLDPGCIQELPTQLPVQEGTTPGRWRLFMEIVVRGANQEELQRESEFSNYVNVVESR